MLVCKFGGSSLADERRFARVREIINSDPRRRCIVVSAPGRRSPSDDKVTDLLIRAAQPSSRACLARVKDIFSSIARALDLGSVENELALIEKACALGRDAAVSRGEWLCAILMSRYLGMPFIDAADVFRFENGVLNRTRTYESLRDRASAGGVIPGFYGSDETGRIVTFPRGGSDVCGALAAAALNAEAYENWTDVNGMHAADPSLLPDSPVIGCMSYSQARLLTSLGANVLHPDCISPVEDANIPIIVKNTFRPDRPGTVISRNGNHIGPCLTARRFPDGISQIAVCGASSAAYARICAAPPQDALCRIENGVLFVDCPEARLESAAKIIYARINCNSHD